MATRRSTWADLALVRSDTGDQQRRDLCACRGFLPPEGPGLGNHRCGQLRPGQQRQDKAVATEAFPETASSVE